MCAPIFELPSNINTMTRVDPEVSIRHSAFQDGLYDYAADVIVYLRERELNYQVKSV